MKKIKTYENFVNELVSFDKREPGTKGSMMKPSKGIEHVIWSNGKIVVNPTQQDMMDPKMGFLGVLNMEVDHNEKTVKLTPFDDWADTKIALKVQKALKDMIRAKYIDETWKCIIMRDKLTKRSLGSTKVKDIIKQDYSYADVIPFAYHGTSDLFLEEIKSKGLMPREESGQEEIWDIGYTSKSQENVYLTTDYARAQYYADYTVKALKEKGIKSKPIVVFIENLPTSNIVMDDDLITNMGMLQLLALLHSGKTKEQFAQGASYITGIRQSGQFAYKGRIPASMITKIYSGRNL